MSYVKVSKDDATKFSWAYDPDGEIGAEKWLDGNKVQGYRYLSLDQDIKDTVQHFSVDAGAYYGKAIARSYYYYLILLGRGEFFFYTDETAEEPYESVPVQHGDLLVVRKGTVHNLQAQHQPLEICLFVDIS